MKLGLAALVVAASGCVLAVGDADEGWYGAEYETTLTAGAPRNCPAGLQARGGGHTTVLQDSIVVNGRVLSANIDEDADGLAIDSVVIPDEWLLDGRRVPVSLDLRGFANKTLELSGTMFSSALAGCEVDVIVAGEIIPVE